jgi:hypothetical protein
MLIAKIENGLVADVQSYRTMFPNTSFPTSGPASSFLDEQGCMKIKTFLPYDQATQKLVSSDPYIDGDWVFTVTVADKTADEIASDNAALSSQLRRQRDNLLSGSDWIVTMHTEIGTDIPVQWKTYRQALRDITAQETFPQSVVWPTEPE